MQEELIFDEKVWTPPESFPDLSQEKLLAIDVETKDPNLTTKGAGWFRDDGHLIGIAVASKDQQWYFPMRHEGRGNLSPNLVASWLCDQLSYGMDVVMHNAQYDLGWLHHEGITVHGSVFDTMVAAALLDENRFSYSLDALGSTYIGKRKANLELNTTASQHGVDAKKEMWRLPAARVANYAETDARITYDLWSVLHQKLIQDDCKNILNLELALIPIIFEMRKKGIRIDLEQAEKTKKVLETKEKKLLQEVKKEVGFFIEPWNATSLAKAFDTLGLEYERTQKSGAPSFTKHFLSNHEHPIAQKILEIREFNKANTTFIDTILSHQHNGRIHCEFNQLRSEVGGTVTGRFSSSHPNLQQVPARHPEIKKMIRGLFLPEEGKLWGSFDYSAQEPRWLMHYVSLTPTTKDDHRVQEIVKQYHQEDFDFHQMVADLAGVERTIAKTINLGIMYGMGLGKLSNVLGDISMEETKEIRNDYDNKVPFIREIANAVAKAAESRKEIRTLLGRKCRFPMREKGVYGSKSSEFLHVDRLEREWQAILDVPIEEREEDWEYRNPKFFRVANTYKALNRLIQASSADQTKQALLNCYNEGFTPMLTVHDELCFSIDKEDISKIKELMENCIKMQVPSKIDVGLGENWGETK